MSLAFVFEKCFLEEAIHSPTERNDLPTSYHTPVRWCCAVAVTQSGKEKVYTNVQINRTAVIVSKMFNTYTLTLTIKCFEHTCIIDVFGLGGTGMRGSRGDVFWTGWHWHERLQR